MSGFVEAPFWGRRRSALQPLHAVSVVVTEPAVEPLSLAEVKHRLRVSSSADDNDLKTLIIAARRQVEKDLTMACLVPTVIDQWMDRPPTTEVMTLTRWPLQSVASIKSYDSSNVETTFDASNYIVDTSSRPGRVILNTGVVWPQALRSHRALVVRHTSGFSGTAKTVNSITRSGTTATVTLAAAHGWTTGRRITIAGADQDDYNGTFEITVTGAATFTFTVENSPATPATGVPTATDLGIPELYTLAVMALVTHWYDNRGPVNIGNIVSDIPLTYHALLSDAPLVMP